MKRLVVSRKSLVVSCWWLVVGEGVFNAEAQRRRGGERDDI